ncbi:porin family protein [Spirosoma validum]|uniref:Porin family protein n=1 Tax=Spirosoma validum TaxID=2771355 RepID=A0A927B2K5_9BACT|nr:OmpW family outer membrane protein [Spirosoma validum]MBD2754431.1 hypothetical protein [Spirosoma validum]
MKRFFFNLVGLVSICLLSALPGRAQFSVGLHGSLASGDAKGSETFYGGGINAKLFLSSKLDIGIGLKAFGENRKFEAVGQSLEYSAGIIPITGMIDYYFTDSFLRPYIGAEVGVYATGYRIKFNNQETSKVNSTNVGVAPKVGLMLALGNLGIFAEGDYNIMFGNKDGSANVGGVGNVNFDRTTKFFMLNVGIQIGIPTTK